MRHECVFEVLGVQPYNTRFVRLGRATYNSRTKIDEIRCAADNNRDTRTHSLRVQIVIQRPYGLGVLDAASNCRFELAYE